MSDLLNQASLVMVPSGYKEDTVYSVVPSNGSGDLSFTRASNGTRVNSAGLVEVTPWNLLQYSETFDTDWTTSNVTITANDTTAPNGTTTAEKALCASGSSISPNIFYSGSLPCTSGQVYTYSYYAKKGTTNFAKIRFSGTAFASVTNSPIFNLNTGVVVSGTGTIESVGNGWYRISATATAEANASGVVTVDIPSSTGVWPNGNFAGTEYIYIYGAQLNIGATAKPYFPTTDRLNVPRLTYQNGGGGCPSLLLEKQSTNLFSYSEDFTNAYWTKYTGQSITANATTSPDGTQNADKMIDAGGFYATATFTASTSYSLSVFIKKDTATSFDFGYIDQRTPSFIGGAITYTFSTGAIVVSQSANNSVSGEAFNFGNGWIRLVIKFTASATKSYDYQYFELNGGDAFIYGFQLEASSYPTSYIPTTSSSATRVADLATVNLPNTNMTFTAYLELDEASLGTPAGDWFSIFSNVSALGRAYGYANQFGFADAYSLGVLSGAKMVWKQESGSTAKIFKGGALVGTSTTGTYTDPFNRLRIDGALLDKSVKIKQFVFFDNALTDAECIQLTA